MPGCERMVSSPVSSISMLSQKRLMCREWKGETQLRLCWWMVSFFENSNPLQASFWTEPVLTVLKHCFLKLLQWRSKVLGHLTRYDFNWLPLPPLPRVKLYFVHPIYSTQSHVLKSVIVWGGGGVVGMRRGPSEASKLLQKWILYATFVYIWYVYSSIGGWFSIIFLRIFVVA